MTDYPAVNDSRASVSMYGYMVGRSSGYAQAPANTMSGQFNIDALSGEVLAGSGLTYVDEGTPSVGGGEYIAVRGDGASLSDDWFETVHLLPRAGVDFGNIVSAVDGAFELFNSSRYASKTLGSIQNNAEPGVIFPDVSAPSVLGPLQSFIDPGSSPLAPEGAIVRALQSGLPNFDTTIDFTFSGVGTYYLRVIGNRIALLTADFDGGVVEILSFLTDILTKTDGSEQRISPRKQPRQRFEASFILDGTQRQTVQSILYGWQANTISIPVWPEMMELTSDITGGTTDTADVDSTSNVDLREGGLAVVFKDDQHFDVLTVSSKTSTSITFDQDISGSYSSGDLVVPVRLASIDGSVQGSRPPVNVEKMQIKLNVIENDIGAPTGDTSAFNSYNGKVLLDDYNFIKGEMQESFTQDVIQVDGNVGISAQDSPWTSNKRGHVKTFVVKTRAALWAVRRLLYALRGRQVSFYIPTFMEDLTVTQDLLSGTDTMDISYVGYSRFVQAGHNRLAFRITFTDGSSLVREVTDYEQLSATEERITVDSNWPTGRTVDEVRRVEFYTLVRLDTDDVRIEHGSTAGFARISVPVVEVFD